MLSAHNTPDLRPSAVGLTPLSNPQAFPHLKRTLSQDTEGGMTDDADAANGRRSKRLKKGKRIRYLQPPPVIRQGCAEAQSWLDLGTADRSLYLLLANTSG